MPENEPEKNLKIQLLFSQSPFFGPLSSFRLNSFRRAMFRQKFLSAWRFNTERTALLPTTPPMCIFPRAEKVY